ncbi:N-acyl-aromatic-L-amino acid amidohydrolase (carboxylate-forming) [Lepisosteus oculatus]|uniref:N-acyl-aromatic-L-amino acid amidohydrolase (carboxylate-forming) n=1 Tax=Lepisosteus oculatus TaxID=7918 RepID=UPI0037238E8E
MEGPRKCYPPLRRVLVSGGTHGNELGGVYVVRHGAPCLRRPSFSTQTVLTNPRATAGGVRHIDTDLNRCFTLEALSQCASADSPYEVRRALELNQTFGPKGSDQAVDFICDLHNTTANTQACLICDTQSDYLSLHAARYLQSLSKQPCRILLMKRNTPSFSFMSIGKHNMTIEMGPQPPGVIRADVYNKTLRLLQCLLDWIELFNRGAVIPAGSVQCFEVDQKIDYPRDSDGQLTACIHPQLQDRDFEPLNPGDPIFQPFSGGDPLVFGGEETVYPVFVNECAYYSKGIAFWTTKKITISLPAITVTQK